MPERGDANMLKAVNRATGIVITFRFLMKLNNGKVVYTGNGKEVNADFYDKWKLL